jgi:hypothetical protein
MRATASAFSYHQGAIWGGLVGLMVSYFAVNEHMGFVRHMLMATILGEISPWRCWQAPNPGKKLFQLGLEVS